MGFVVQKVALRHVCLLVLQFSPLRTIPPTLLRHLHLQVFLTRRTNGGKFGASKRSGQITAMDRETLHFPQLVTLHATELTMYDLM